MMVFHRFPLRLFTLALAILSGAMLMQAASNAAAADPHPGHIAILKGKWLIEIGPVRLSAQFDDASRYHVGGPFTVTVAAGGDCSSVLSAVIRGFCTQPRDGGVQGYMTFDFRESEQEPPRHKGVFGPSEVTQEVTVIAEMANGDLAWLRIGDGGRARMSRLP
jgi:hypothetical protein